MLDGETSRITVGNVFYTLSLLNLPKDSMCFFGLAVGLGCRGAGPWHWASTKVVVLGCWASQLDVLRCVILPALLSGVTTSPAPPARLSACRLN